LYIVAGSQGSFLNLHEVVLESASNEQYNIVGGTSSSMYNWGVISKCYDGNMGNLCHSGTSSNWWASFDLGAEACVGVVKLYNRKTWPGRLVGAVVSLRSAANEVLWTHTVASGGVSPEYILTFKMPTSTTSPTTSPTSSPTTSPTSSPTQVCNTETHSSCPSPASPRFPVEGATCSVGTTFPSTSCYETVDHGALGVSDPCTLALDTSVVTGGSLAWFTSATTLSLGFTLTTADNAVVTQVCTY